MKKIFIYTPFASDANSFWRCIGPFSYLRKFFPEEVSFYVPPPKSTSQWDAIAEFDAVFMHRPCDENAIKLMQIARNLNVPVWVDYDDWLFHLPYWNPHADAYHQPAVQHIMATCIACADVVTVSTGALQKEFSKINSNVVITPNAYWSELFSTYRGDVVPPRKDIFYWRGTNTHDGDLTSVIDAFDSLPKKTVFLGSPAYQLLQSMKPEMWEKQGPYDAIRYWKAIYDLAPKVLLFPLADHHFNLCKSNIAWIEALHAGAIVVAPNMPEWKHPGVISYEPNDAQAFLNAAEEAMDLSPEQVRDINQNAFHYMQSKFGMKTISQIRIEILKTICSTEFKRNDRDPFQQITGMWALKVLKGEITPANGQNKSVQSPENP